MRSRRAAVLAFLVALVAVASQAAADGMYWPEVAYPSLPEIPSQRALIVYRDGRETLVVESALKSDSPGIGWVLPLPAEPEKIEVADGGLLTTLAVCLGPEVIHDLTLLWLPAVDALVFVAPIALVIALARDWFTRIVGAIYWFFISFLVLSLFGHAGAGPGGETASPDVEVSAVHRVGDYDVAVLRAPTAQALGRWLDENGLRSLDDAAAAVVGDYVARGWCFAVARLRRDGGGDATPHPIQVTFPAKEPVYPMRLTALAGRATRVELFVVADRMAAAKGFHCASADRYSRKVLDDRRWGDFDLMDRMAGVGPADVPVLVGGSRRCEIGHAGALALAWDDCVVTRLEARLTPAEMRADDVTLRLEDPRPHRDVFFSAKGRRGALASVLLWGAVFFVGGLGLACRGRRRPSRGAWRVLGIVCVLTFVLGAAAFFSHGVVPVGPGSHRIGHRVTFHDFQRAVQIMVVRGRLHRETPARDWDRLSDEIVERGYFVPDEGYAFLRNPYTGGPIRRERSPGNFDVRRIGDKTYFCLYDERGVEHPAVALPAPPEDASTPGGAEGAGPRGPTPQP